MFWHVLTIYAIATPSNDNQGANSTRDGIGDRQDYHDSQFSQNPLVDKKEWVFATAPDGRYCKDTCPIFFYLMHSTVSESKAKRSLHGSIIVVVILSPCPGSLRKAGSRIQLSPRSVAFRWHGIQVTMEASSPGRDTGCHEHPPAGLCDVSIQHSQVQFWSLVLLS